MGKSLGNALYLSDDYSNIKEKIMNAKTDPARIKKDDKGHPQICMVYYYHNLFSSTEDCKKQLIENTDKVLQPIREKRHYYEERPNEVIDILMAGTSHAKEIAKQTMKRVKKSMKLDY